MSQPGNGREVASDYLSASSTDVLIFFLQGKHLGITFYTTIIQTITKASTAYRMKEEGNVNNCVFVLIRNYGVEQETKFLS